MKKNIYSLKANELPELNQVGGKAQSLIIMTQEHFPVPEGIVLLVDFFEPWLKQVEEMHSWKGFLKSSEEELKKYCDAIKKECGSLNLNDTQKKELDEALKEFDRDTLFAVRSSSPEEDLEGTSFAGGYETTLGVTQKNLEKAILDSFISVFDERIVRYKQQHGIKIDQPKIAVIIQKQIASNASGVAFSLNPQNNCYDETVINANFGLGETVVAGQVTPDTYIVDKIKQEILEKKIGEKDHALWLKKNGGSQKKKNENPKSPALSDGKILEVAELAAKIERHYEKPMDIEWAYEDENLYLLQARPVTAYFPVPKGLRTKPGEQKYLYVNMGLVKQGIPGVISPMGTSIFSYVTNIMGDMFSEMLISDPKNGISAFSDGVMMSQLGNMEKMLGRRANIAAIEIGGKSVVETYRIIDMKDYLPKRLPKTLSVMRRKLIWFSLKQLPGILKSFLKGSGKYLEEYKKHDLEQEKEHYELSKKHFKNLNDVTRASMKTNMESLIDQVAVIILGARLAKRRISKLFKDDGVEDLLTNLEMALPGNKTSEMGQMMYDLAKQTEIQESKDAKEFVQKLKDRKFPKDFLKKWDDYIVHHGFRGMGELDIATPRSYEDLPGLFDTIKDMSKQAEKNKESTFERAKRKREEAYQKLYALAEKKGKRTLKKFKKNYDIFLSLAGLRENPKYNMIRMFDLIRREALRFGRQFVKERRLDKAEDIFNLTVQEVDQALKDESLNLKNRIEKNTAYAKQLKGRDVPVFFDSRGKIFHPPTKDAGDNMLPGQPIASGKVTGHVKVLKNAHEKPILPGEILVAKATDPGWTPLFINAGGIILENGGTLQHGAVVAREYGKPCVSSVVDATKILKDGQKVEVDGSQGLVKIIENNDSYQKNPDYQ